MASRVKEDAKNEKTIRNLLKLSENRRCINCNSLGPQYVCTNFWTFVCTNCSGIHREFTHRVKSISMAKFTSQEVASLQGGGNARAKEVYLKELDSQRNSFPDSSHVEKLRDFIRHVYVDRRYTGERSLDKPPRGKMGEPEDSYANKRNDAYHSGSRSPASEDGYERRYGDRPSPGGRSDDRSSLDSRSPGYLESRQYGDNRKSPAHTEVVNDWRREDRFGNGRKTDDSRTFDTRSPDLQKDGNISSPPMARPVREILGDNVLPLRIEPPKDNGSFVTQRSVSSSSLASSNGNPAETKNENFGSLIDFDAFAEPIPVTATTTQQTQQAVPDKSTDQLGTLSNADNWACFDSAPTTIPSASSNDNPLLSVFSQFSSSTSVVAPSAVAPGSNNLMPGGDLFALQSSTNPPVAPPGQMFVSNDSNNVQAISSANNLNMSPPANYPSFGLPAAAPANNFAQFPSATVPVAVSGPPSGYPSNVPTSHGMPHGQHPSFPPSQSFAPSVGGPPNNQPWNSSIAPTSVASSNVSPVPTGQSGFLPFSEAVHAGAAQPSSTAEPKSASRKELPQDIFASTYPSYGGMPGWQTAPLPGYGLQMQYNNPAMQMPHPHLQSSKSSNPFDLNDEMPPPAQVSSNQFPSMGSMQDALPMWGSQSSSYSSGVPQAQQPFMPPPNSLMTQSVPNNNIPISRPPPPQGVMDFFGAEFATSNPPPGHDHHHQQQMVGGGIYSAGPVAAANTFPSMGGNPFG
ncbi:probable ADP-ribosylation factor GTPase-activating protein AGD14 isoform X2 [Impatiens glandulifera]|uniref:probable ADP-ribosylation factor GTPase-activating protein AGD14 isoform X2 n=1 Tax=Impatiens glandulifera TaxID=253017 RepID=UPI001FB1738F|nr:probable ADP-ribosylation factor GTPase-activating protein AGD14 isoform X2 [Impatiens glandulifera]